MGGALGMSVKELDLQEGSGAGLASKAVGGSQDAAGVRGLLGGDGASSGQHEGGRWKKPRDGARRGRSGGAGTPPRTGAGLPLPARGGGSGSGCRRPAPPPASAARIPSRPGCPPTPSTRFPKAR